MKVRTDELRSIFNKLMDYYENNGIKEFDVKQDMYWEVAADKCYDPRKKPEPDDLVLGQTSDEFKWLKDFLNSKDEEAVTSVQLNWLARLIQFISVSEHLKDS